MNVLVVEHDRSLLDTMETILAFRYRVTRAESCEAARDLLETQPAECPAGAAEPPGCVPDLAGGIFRLWDRFEPEPLRHQHILADGAGGCPAAGPHLAIGRDHRRAGSGCGLPAAGLPVPVSERPNCIINRILSILYTDGTGSERPVTAAQDLQTGNPTGTNGKIWEFPM